MKRTVFTIMLLLISGILSFAQSDIDCAQPLEIWQIQGSGAVANCLDQRIITENNIVTLVGRVGFFIQTPDSRADDDPATSNGIYVFTERSAGRLVKVGDLVHIDGRVKEFFGLSQLEAPTPRRITVVSSDNPLPAVIDLKSVDLSYSAQGLHPLERYEGMRVRVEDAFITSPTNQFDEFGVTLDDSRSFREAGIEPDLMPEFAGQGLPEWDLNPELIEIDAYETAQPVLQIPFGGRATAEGALSYSFNDYQIWPAALDVTEAEFSARPVRPRLDGEFTIATQNVENLFDLVDDPNRSDGRFENWTPTTEEEYRLRLEKHSEQIRVVLGAPDILAIQEIENMRVLTDLALQIHADDPTLIYAGCLLEGTEGRGIDVAYLFRTDRVNMHDCYRMPGSLEARFRTTDDLLDRPPLMFSGEFVFDGQAFPILLMNLHLRSLSDVDTDRVQQKRLEQAVMIADYIQHLQTENPALHLAILGDLNAFQFSDGLVDMVGILSGTHDPAAAVAAPENDLVEPNLSNVILRLPEAERYSYIFNHSAQSLDHFLANNVLDAYISEAQYGRGNADAPIEWFGLPTGSLRSSDHDGLVVYIQVK